MSQVRYRVQCFDFGASFGIGNLIAEFEKPKSVGWGSYVNDVGEAFWTVYQDDPQLVLLRGHEGKCHVRILRNDEIVWTGWGAMEVDATDTDAILYAYSYLAGLYWMNTDWNKTWQGAEVGTIVSDTWTYVKTTLTNSRLAFVTTGTIEDPVTTSGGATPLTLPTYSAFWKRALFVMKEMAALSISDTSNTVVFEITDATTPTFNFWKNRGVDRPNVLWQWGDGTIVKFHDYRMPVYHRNDIPVAGSAPNNELLRYEWTDSTDISSWGRMQEALFFSWVRDQTELQRATALRGNQAKRDYTDLTLRFRPNSVVPPGVAASTFALADRVKVKIDRGITNIDDYFLVSGFQVFYRRGVEYPNALLQQKAVTS